MSIGAPNCPCHFWIGNVTHVVWENYDTITRHSSPIFTNNSFISTIPSIIGWAIQTTVIIIFKKSKLSGLKAIHYGSVNSLWIGQMPLLNHTEARYSIPSYVQKVRNVWQIGIMKNSLLCWSWYIQLTVPPASNILLSPPTKGDN